MELQSHEKELNLKKPKWALCKKAKTEQKQRERRGARGSGEEGSMQGVAREKEEYGQVWVLLWLQMVSQLHTLNEPFNRSLPLR
jgi:hypothetical protein